MTQEYNKIQKKLLKWEKNNFYKTKTARSALLRFATYLDIEMAKEDKERCERLSSKHAQELAPLPYA